MKKFILPVVSLFAALTAAAQKKVIHLKQTDVPADMKYNGGSKGAVQYTDKNGLHTVIITDAVAPVLLTITKAFTPVTCMRSAI